MPGADHKGQGLQCPQWRHVSSRSSSVERKPKKYNSKGTAQETVKGRTHGDCNQRTSKGQTFTMYTKSEQGKEDPVLSPKREDTRKETEGKGCLKGKGPKGTSPSRKSNIPSLHSFPGGATTEGPTCDNWYTPKGSHYKSQGGCKWEDTCVFQHTGKAGE